MVLIGYAASVSLAFFNAAKDLVSKSISKSLSGSLSAFASFLYAVPYYLILLPILWYLGFETFSVQSGFFLLIVLRALSDTGAEWTKMESIGRADISLVSAFQSLSPAFLALFSPLITGDPISLNALIGLIIISIAGILLANPFRTGDKLTLQGKSSLTGTLFGILCAFFFSINHCLDRLAAQTASAPLSAFAMTVLAGIFLFPAARYSSPTPFKDLEESNKPLFLRGFFEVIAMVSKLYALQYLTAPVVVAVGRLAVPLSIVVGSILYKEKDLRRRLALGSVMVAGSILTLF